MNTTTLFTEQQLWQFVSDVFIRMGHSEADAHLATDVLLEADLRGIDSHGVARLSGYVRLWEAGRLNTQPNIKVVRETMAAATVDGDAGLGLIVAARAMDLAIQKASATGVGMISVCNSNHFGIAAYHAMKGIPHHMIGMASTNASPLVAPTRSRERMLGTNPHCWVFPARKYDAVVIDMASSAAANGKLEIAERNGTALPEGWAVGPDGGPATRPDVLKEGGSLLPLGSSNELGSHKGYGLAAVADLLSGVLSGANFGPWVPPFVSFLQPPAHPVGKGIGHFVGAMRIDAFRDLEGYYSGIDTWIERFKVAQPINLNEPVLIHGEPEMLHYRQRKKEGIPLNNRVVIDLQDLGTRFELSL
jgi:LDH2 family malate/lactate/ureidoglycolate dehydrogenase